MNSLPAYTSITGGGRLGNKPYKSNYVYVSSQVLAMPDNLLWRRESWPVGFKNAHGIIYMMRQEWRSTYALWSGFRKGTMDPNLQDRKDKKKRVLTKFLLRSLFL